MGEFEKYGESEKKHNSKKSSKKNFKASKVSYLNNYIFT